MFPESNIDVYNIWWREYIPCWSLHVDGDMDLYAYS